MNNKSIYISSLEIGADAFSVTISMMQFLKQNFQKVAFFKPLVNNKNDNNISFILEHFKIKQKKQETYGITLDEFQKNLALNKEDIIYEMIIEKFRTLQKNHDFVLIQGFCKDFLPTTIDFDINLTLAKHFNTSFMSVLNGDNKTKNQIKKEIFIDIHNIEKEGSSHFATFVNNVYRNDIPDLNSLLSKQKNLVFCLPKIKELSKLTMYEVQESLNAKLIFGDKKNLNQKISDVKIASMTLDNFLLHIKHENLVIVSGDRSDIILGTFSAILSKNMPHIAGVVLTGNIEPKQSIINLLEGFKDSGICVLSVDEDTYQTALKVTNTAPLITDKNYTKIALILGRFIKYVSNNLLTKALDLVDTNIMTPIMFEYNLFEQARVEKKNIVLNESGDDRILRAAEVLIHRKVVNITLIGVEDDILHRANILGIDLNKANIIDPKTSKLTNKFAKEFYNLRKHKGILLEHAKDLMLTKDVYFATMLVHFSYVDGMVSGAIGTTADTIRPALQIIKTKKDIDIVSSVFFMCLDTKVLVYGDCAINPSPNANQLSQIAISSAQTAKQFGIEPKVAMLSYSTGCSGKGEDVELVSLATQEVKKKDSSIIIEGPIQYDAAIDKKTALKKSPDGLLKGDATVLIFPDLNTGNNTYKAVQRSSGAVAIGPILQGLNKPINDLSRGCKVVDIVNTVTITAIQAQELIK